MVRGQIFLNCSLTESFCIAILEAASCGLFVVSTKVGGVVEVLPPSMIKFSEPNSNDLLLALSEAIVTSRRIVPSEMHERVKRMYSWHDVAQRLDCIYQRISVHSKRKFPSLATRFLRYSAYIILILCILLILRTLFDSYMSAGPWAGLAAVIIAACLHVLWKISVFLWPAESIEICPAVTLRQRTSRRETFNVA